MLAATRNTILEQKPSGNHGGRIREHKYLVMHYTGGDRLDNAVAWLRTPAAKASSQVVIGQDGRIVQLVPFDIVAWHAGESKYGEDRNLNSLSIGIELVNPGPVSRLGKDRWSSGRVTYGPDDVVHAQGKVWAKYPQAQMDAAIALSRDLCAQYKISQIVGHSDICVPAGRKQDPGPAFDLVAFRAEVLVCK